MKFNSKVKIPVGFFCIFVGVCVVVSWSANVDFPVWMLIHTVPMNPLTAVGFIFCGLSLSLAQTNSKQKSVLSLFSALFVISIALYKILGLFIYDLKLDQILFSSKVALTEIPNAMAPNTAINFLFAGLSLAFIHRKNQRVNLSDLFCVPVILIAMSGVVGYLYFVSRLSQVGSFIPIAFHTALTFLVLGFGLLFVNSDSGFISVLRNSHLGAVMARRLILPVTVVPLLLGWIKLQAQSRGFVSPEFSTSVMAILCSLIGLVVIFRGAKVVNQLDEDVKDRMKEELKAGRLVQDTLFPTDTAKLGDLEISGYYEPASECGGDWWYHSKIGKKILICIGDATGHGVPAALITSATRSAMAIVERLGVGTPAKILDILNDAIYTTCKGRMWMTFFIATIDSETGEVCYCNASHEAPFVLTEADDSGPKEFKWLNKVNDAHLGNKFETAYHEASIKLSKGSAIFFYTDGLVNISDPKGRLWGERRLQSKLAEIFTQKTSSYEFIGHMKKKASANIATKQALVTTLLFVCANIPEIIFDVWL